MANTMVSITSYDGATYDVNPNHVESIEDTIIKTGTNRRYVYLVNGASIQTSTSLSDLLTAVNTALNGSARVFTLTGVSGERIVNADLNVINILYAAEAPEQGSSLRKIVMRSGRTYYTSRALTDLLSDMNTAIA